MFLLGIQMKNHKHSLKRLILSILLTGVFVFLCAPLYSNYRLNIEENTSPTFAEIEIAAVKDDNSIVNDTRFSDIKAQKCSSNAKNCMIFSKQASSLSTPFNIKIHFTKSGKAVLTLKISTTEEMSTIKLNYNKMQINGKPVFSNIKIGQANPYYYKFEVSEGEPIQIKMNVKEHYKIKFNMLLSVIILSFLLAYKAIDYISTFKLQEKHSRIDIVFVVIFAVLLFIPMSHISNAQKSVEENRMLSKYPSMFVGKMFNNQYGTKFEQWFNDHFFGRSFLLKIFKNKINVAENDMVFEGPENWIFYKGENGIRNFQNLDLFSEEELNSVGNYLNDIQMWCIKNNKKFYVIIPPDKSKVYGEFYPQRIKKLNPDSESRTNQLVNYIHQKYPNINILYLQQTMLSNKEKGLLYWKNDSHWNDLGAYFGYLELMKLIQKDYPDIKISQENFLHSEPFRGMMMGLGDENVYEKLTYKCTQKAYNCYEVKNSEKSVTHKCQNVANEKNLFLLRDSFSGSIKGQVKGWLPYLYESFGNIYLKWRYKINYNDMKELKASDIVILEIIERHLPNLRNMEFPKD